MEENNDKGPPRTAGKVVNNISRICLARARAPTAFNKVVGAACRRMRASSPDGRQRRTRAPPGLRCSIAALGMVWAAFCSRLDTHGGAACPG